MRAAKLGVYGAILAGTLALALTPVLAGLRLRGAPVADPTGAQAWAPYAVLGLVGLVAYTWILWTTLRRGRLPTAVYLLSLLTL